MKNILKSKKLKLPKNRHWQVHNNLVIENTLLKKMLGLYDQNLKLVAQGLEIICEQISEMEK